MTVKTGKHVFVNFVQYYARVKIHVEWLVYIKI